MLVSGPTMMEVYGDIWWWHCSHCGGTVATVGGMVPLPVPGSQCRVVDGD